MTPTIYLSAYHKDYQSAFLDCYQHLNGKIINRLPVYCLFDYYFGNYLSKDINLYTFMWIETSFNKSSLEFTPEEIPTSNYIRGSYHLYDLKLIRPQRTVQRFSKGDVYGYLSLKDGEDFIVFVEQD